MDLLKASWKYAATNNIHVGDSVNIPVSTSLADSLSALLPPPPTKKKIEYLNLVSAAWFNQTTKQFTVLDIKLLFIT